MISLTYKQTRSQFDYTLRSRVRAYLDVQKSNRSHMALFKALSICTLAILNYWALLFTTHSFTVGALLCLSLGVFNLLLGLNVLHESCHGNLSDHDWLNRLFGFGFDIVGGISSQQYRFKHNVIHHRYTNLNHLDGDLDNLSILRLGPEFKWMPIHRYQVFYAPILYLLLTMTWAFNDIERLFTGKVSAHTLPDYSWSERLKQIMLKLIYVFFALALPIYIAGWAKALAGFVFVHAIMGISIALIFQVAHTVEICDFPSAGDGARVQLDESLPEHQLRTTANFSHNPIADFIFGGLNYQIEHHLFPNVSARHLPAVSQIVRETCAEYGVRYNYFPSFWSAVGSHFAHLRNMGQFTQSTNR